MHIQRVDAPSDFCRTERTQFHILFQVAVVRNGRTADHRFQCERLVYLDAFGDRVGQYRNGVVADHAEVFIAHVRPYRQCVVDALLVVLQHRFDHVGVAFAVDDVVEGHQGRGTYPTARRWCNW